MLDWADHAVVERDPALPGLALLLDGAALAAWLTQRTGVPCRVVGGRLRYKPGTSCAWTGAVVRGGERLACLALAYRVDEPAKLVKAVDGAPAGAVLAVEPGRGLLVAAWTGDRALPALGRLAEPSSLERLLRRLLGRPVEAGAALRTVRHNPRRRWVGVLDEPAGRVVLRAYPTGGARPASHRYAAVSGGPPRTPRLLGRTRRYELLAVEWVEGQVLADAGATGPAAPASCWAPVGAAVAGLHGRHLPAPGRLPRHGPAREGQAVGGTVDQLCLLLPELAPRLRQVAARTTERLARPGGPGGGPSYPGGTPGAPVVLHGDLAADQVVLTPGGEAALVDLDAACLGPAALDLAGLAAATPPAEAWAAVLAGYTDLRPLPDAGELAAYTAARLLRRASDPFRDRVEDWPRVVADLVEHADERMDRADLAGGARC